MIAFGIRYLNGFVAAAEPDDRDCVEWPPHPGRIFMALAAAHFQTGADPEERKALLWLEALERDGEPVAPCIVAQEAIPRSVVTHYVPINDHNAGYKVKNKKVVVFPEIGQTGVRRERQDRTFASAWLKNDTVFLVWPEADPDDSVRSALEGLCAKVTRIGHSSSLVQMWIARSEEAGEPNWIPDEDRAEIRLRLAPCGTLEYLERRYNGAAVETFAVLKVTAVDDSDKKAQRAARKRLKEEFSDGSPPQLRPQLSMYQGYARPAPPDASYRAPGSVFSPHLIVLRIDAEDGPYRHLDLSCVLTVAQRWREALLSHSNDLSTSVRTVLSGHDVDGVPLEGPHLAFVPIAFVGREHADGHLLGMGVSLPDGLSRNDRRGVLQAMDRVRRLKLGRLGIWRVEAVNEARPPWNLLPKAWTAHPEGATQWSTVTPVVYDRHPKTKDKGVYQEEVATMIRQCCTRIGLPPPREVIITPVSLYLGTPPAHDFPRLRRKDNSLRRHTHAIIVFDQAVRGPILLGAGRYRGYGLCRPMGKAPAVGGGS